MLHEPLPGLQSRWDSPEAGAGPAAGSPPPHSGPAGPPGAALPQASFLPDLLQALTTRLKSMSQKAYLGVAKLCPPSPSRSL